MLLLRQSPAWSSASAAAVGDMTATLSHGHDPAITGMMGVALLLQSLSAFAYSERKWAFMLQSFYRPYETRSELRPAPCNAGIGMYDNRAVSMTSRQNLSKSGLRSAIRSPNPEAIRARRGQAIVGQSDDHITLAVLRICIDSGNSRGACAVDGCIREGRESSGHQYQKKYSKNFAHWSSCALTPF